MRTRIRFHGPRIAVFLAIALVMLVVLATAMLASNILAQVASPIASWQDVVVYLIPIIVPILIALAKKWLYDQVILADGTISFEAPRWFPPWLLPVIAPFLGMLIDWLMSLAGVPGTNTLQAALLGGLGVFIRELTKPLTNKTSALKAG